MNVIPEPTPDIGTTSDVMSYIIEVFGIGPSLRYDDLRLISLWLEQCHGDSDMLLLAVDQAVTKLKAHAKASAKAPQRIPMQKIHKAVQRAIAMRDHELLAMPDANMYNQ